MPLQLVISSYNAYPVSAVRVSLFLHCLSKEIQCKKCFRMKTCFVPLKDHFCTLPRTCISQPGSGTVSTTSWCALLFVRYFLSSCSIYPLSSCKCIPFSSFFVKRNLMQEMLLNEKLLCATQISLLYYSSLKPTFGWT